MPTYDYRCAICGYRFSELLSRWDDDEDIVCPHCLASTTERLMSAPAVITGSSAPRHASSGCGCGSGNECACA